MSVQEDENLPPATHGCRLVALVLCSALLAAGCGAPEPEEIAGWDASDETRVDHIDHSAWQDLLDDYVAPDATGVNLVLATTRRWRPTPGTPRSWRVISTTSSRSTRAATTARSRWPTGSTSTTP